MLDNNQILIIAKNLTKHDHILDFKFYDDGHLAVILNNGQKFIFSSEKVNLEILKLESLKSKPKSKITEDQVSKPVSKSRGRPSKASKT